MPTPEIIRALRDLRLTFGRRPRTAKRRWLRQAVREPLNDARILRDYHDTLLFMAAYPDNPELLRMVTAELKRVGRAARQFSRTAKPRTVACLRDTGMAGTEMTCAFSLDMATWLAKTFPGRVELDWDDDSAGSELDEFLSFLTCSVERDGLLSDRLTTREWVRSARGDGSQSDLAWLAEQFHHLDALPALREQAYETLDLKVRWRLGLGAASRTLVRFPPRRTFFQEAALNRAVDLREWMARPLPGPHQVSVTEARPLLDACRVTLCVRHREIDTLSYVNEREVSHFQLERGIDVTVFGMRPDRRLPIESYFGFVVARNRVPVGYGGGWVFLDRSEIGVNVFDEFRGGESAFLFAQVMRVYHQCFSARRFFVDPYQFGADNAEAIQSGAYWFYDRLGFRPVDKKTRSLADLEREKRSRLQSYRCPTRVLRRLARSKLVFDLDAAAPAHLEDVKLSDIGLAVTRWIGSRFSGDRRAAQRWSCRRAIRALGVRDMARWPREQQESFCRMSLLLGPMAGLSTWPAADKAALVQVMRAKGGVSERNYVRKLRSHARLRAGLADLARRGRSKRSPLGRG
jgi:hypothetical protein